MPSISSKKQQKPAFDLPRKKKRDGRTYRIPRRFQTVQARKAGIDYKIVDGYIPELE